MIRQDGDEISKWQYESRVKLDAREKEVLCLQSRKYECRSNNLSMTIKQATANLSRHSRVGALDHDDDDDDAGWSDKAMISEL